MYNRSIRPNQHKWDLRFLEMAQLVAGWSKDPSTKCGAVIVRPDNTVVSVGFNGFPKDMNDNTELYANRETKYSRIIHCEMNALIFAKEVLWAYSLYTWPFLSCDRCAVHMIQAGIGRFVAPMCPPDKLERWGEALKRTKDYCLEAGVDVVEVQCQE